jgi:hypothetical protein
MRKDNLKKYFWDINFKDLDLKDDYFFIIERVLNFGNADSIKWLKKNYNKDKIKEVVQNSRNLNDKTRNFWNIIYLN